MRYEFEWIGFLVVEGRGFYDEGVDFVVTSVFEKNLQDLRLVDAEFKGAVDKTGNNIL